AQRRAGGHSDRRGSAGDVPAQTRRSMSGEVGNRFRLGRRADPRTEGVLEREESMKRLFMLAAALSLVLGVGHALAQSAPNFDYPAEFAKQKANLTAAPANPNDPIYLQHIGTDMVDTTKFKKAPPWTLCFSNAAVDNPWRVVGLKDMQAQVAVDKAN